MGIWDVLSGKVLRWNQAKSESHRLVAVRLHQHMTRCDTAPLSSIKLRNSLYSYWFAGATYLFSLDGELARYKDRLMSLHAFQLCNLVCAFHCRHVLSVYLADYEETGVIGYHMMQAICKMYDKDNEYIDSWMDCEQFNADGSRSFRAIYKLQAEVAPILGSSPDNVLETVFWSSVASTIANSDRRIYDNPKWGSIVDEEIAASLS